MFIIMSHILVIFSYTFPFLILAATYFFGVYLPSKGDDSKFLYLQKHLKVGDRVCTTGGLLGTIYQKQERTVLLASFDGSLVEVEIESICKKF